MPEQGPERRVITLRVAGRTYRFVTTAAEDDLERMATIVEARIAELSPGRGATLEGVMLAALSLARDWETERDRSDALRACARGLTERVLARVQVALGEATGSAEGDPE